MTNKKTETKKDAFADQREQAEQRRVEREGAQHVDGTRLGDKTAEASQKEISSPELSEDAAKARDSLYLGSNFNDINEPGQVDGEAVDPESGVLGTRQREQILSAERMLAQRAARDAIAAGDSTTMRNRDKAEQDVGNGYIAATVPNKEGDPAPDGSDHTVGVDWFNNRTVTTDEWLKGPDDFSVTERRIAAENASDKSTDEHGRKKEDKKS